MVSLYTQLGTVTLGALYTHICMYVRIYVCIVHTYHVFVCMCFAWYFNYQFLLSFHDNGIVVCIGCCE
jgi:hypothetical protein